MKRLFSILLIALLLAGCGGKPAAAPTPTERTPETTQEATQPETVPTETQAPAKIVDAVTVPEEAAGVAESVITENQKTVHVSTADEFLSAIGPDTEIIVDARLIDFSTAANYGSSGGDYYRWDDPFDGPELVIQNVRNMTVRGGGEVRTDQTLSCVPRYADVVTFENCANIYVTHITVGHTREPGSCMGGVLHYVNSQDILVEDCDLYGCGTLGVIGTNSRNIQVINNHIHDCSVGGVEFSHCQDVRVDGNTFENLGDEWNEAPIFRIYGGENMTCNGEDVIKKFGNG